MMGMAAGSDTPRRNEGSTKRSEAPSTSPAEGRIPRGDGRRMGAADSTEIAWGSGSVPANSLWAYLE